MSAPLLPTVDLNPDWLLGEMPPGYENRVVEIRRLTAELAEMSRFAHLLTEVGPGLADAVREVFVSLGFSVEPLHEPGGPGLAVRVDGAGTLLLHVADGAGVVQKKSREIATVFQLMQELAGDRDRVVLLTNCEPDRKPSERGDALAADAAAFLQRMGATHVTAPTMFALWKLSLQEPARARTQVMRLYELDGGTYVLPPNALL